MRYYFINNYMYNYIFKKDFYTLDKCEIKYIDAFLFKSLSNTVFDRENIKVEMTTRKGLIDTDGVHGTVIGVPSSLDKYFLSVFDFTVIELDEVIVSIPNESKDVECIAILI